MPDDSAPDDGTLRAALSNFSEKFDDYMARWGLLQALALFRRELIETRDASTSAVDALDSAQKVNRYLSTGGADAAIIATDISQADKLPLFFTLDQRLLDPQGKPTSTVSHLHDATREILQRNARQLLMEHNTTVALLTSHSQLLLASENGKLQNKLSWYTRLAFFIAAASLIVALCQLFKDDHQTSSSPTDTGSAVTRDR